MSCQGLFRSEHAFADCLFLPDVLPLGRRPTAEEPPSLPATCLSYLGEALVGRRPQRAACRSGWAFAITGAVQAATLLQYRRAGLRFDNRHMSVEFLLSCMTDASSTVCGCDGADLCTALLRASEQGLVTFRQFQYVQTEPGAPEVDPKSRVSLNYFCEDTSFYGACRPCEASTADYLETARVSSTSETASYFEVTCMPCVLPASPRYFPVKPFRVAAPAWGVDEQASAIKRELLRLGPLPAALAVDVASFRRLAPAQRVSSPRAGALYRRSSTAVSAPDVGLHGALVVGYWDHFPSTRASADRAEAFWILRSPLADTGYTLQLSTAGGETLEVDGLLNVSMYAGEGLLQGVLAFEGVRIQTDVLGPARELSATDPLVAPSSQPMATATSGDAQGSPSHRRRWLVVFLALALLAGLAVTLLR